jgi:hypothetical protein
LIGIRSGGLLHLSEDISCPYPIRRADDPAKLVPDSIIKSNKILRDREGGIWIGTDDIGLHHVVDGKAESFSVANGLSGDIACSLFEDREGNIWFSSEKGLDRFRNCPSPRCGSGRDPRVRSPNPCWPRAMAAPGWRQRKDSRDGGMGDSATTCMSLVYQDAGGTGSVPGLTRPRRG